MWAWVLFLVPALATGLRAERIGRQHDSATKAMYDQADEIATDIEQNSAGVPIGATGENDLALLRQMALPPNLYENCMLIHDTARPFRVGSAMVSRKVEMGLNATNFNVHTVDSTAGAIEMATDEVNIPVDDLRVSGGAYGGPASLKEATITSTMTAYLSSVSGQVQVMPNGIVSKWTSKERVPIAGYLCTQHNSIPVLHTLPTPCVMTSLTEDGERIDPDHKGADVWVGQSRFSFPTIKAAHTACHKLAREIARAPSGNLNFHEKDIMRPESFLQATKQAKARAYTTGAKRLLVVVMDWKYGDSSMSPYSNQQSDAVRLYRETIMPRVAHAFDEMSGGQYTLDVTVLPEIVPYAMKRSTYYSSGFPFPALYDAAEVTVQGRSSLSQYKFSNYDLVYVIAPQQNPIGTKGVAWVGAKGAMCNGCEAISDNFKVMVAVHELGHNLGLSHASSKDLAYGNPFDWMGNYPDTSGLTYGLGYKLALGWIKQDQIFTVDDSSLNNGLSTMVHMSPFDDGKPVANGAIVGIRIALSDNDRDIYIGFREATTDKHDGVYVVFQDRDSPASELMDAACHSPTQQDAVLAAGMTFLDPSTKVAVVVKQVGATAEVHVYSTQSSHVDEIRGREKFTDGAWKCPRTCTDSDLLVADFGSCGDLENQGYCSGSITMMNSKFDIGKDLCPQACGECGQALAGSTFRDGGCGDSDVTINGMKCWKIASEGYCSSSTNIGSIGYDLCPASCGNCPPKPTTSTGSVADPEIAQTVGIDPSGDQGVPFPGITTAAPGDATTAAPDATTAAPVPDETATTTAAPEDQDDDQPCQDDIDWVDVDGDGCAQYAAYVAQNPDLDVEGVCSYGDGGASLFCRHTCQTCEPTEQTCADQLCVNAWREAYGRCYQCEEWSVYCDMEEHFKMDCPVTCGTCTPEANTTTISPDRTTTTTTTTETTTTTTTTTTILKVCEDHECVDHWLKETGKCMHCEDFTEYCVEEDFAEACPLTCQRCQAIGPPPVCEDQLELATCSRYLSWGWCSFDNIASRCRGTCGLCTAELAAIEKEESKTVLHRGMEAMGLNSSAAAAALFFLFALNA